MVRPAGRVVRLATPLKSVAQRFSFVLIIAATFLAMLVGKADTLLIERLRTRVLDAVQPILLVASRPVESVDGLLQELREMAELRTINAGLREENRRLLQWQQKARRLEAENRALQGLLHVTAPPATRFVTAQVVADTSGAFARSLLLAAGARDGVERGQAALAPEGLVGRVVEVGERSSRVLQITDINSRIPVLIGYRRERAVMAGDNSPQPTVAYLSPGSEVRPGDVVVTSGDGGVFPPDLPVGMVASSGEQGLRIRPYADLGRSEYLRVADYQLPDLLDELSSSRGPAQPPAR